MGKYWLLKSEPDVWSIEQQKKAGQKGVAWDGVRNFQAANNLKAMRAVSYTHLTLPTTPYV